ncbi:hypothetical protein BKA93DRAFT_826863 [Sparassis latifolia]|uniref:Uncharacterized protein n=1 Tax=Sparassis crispa TaxID=139825 RepID=A0A401GT04_9APHY|nr:hypothetical protein SCP_0704860 [Sparassis crispa]GBE85299.1 hypothetical protein SCP_0704860 [Sparassis crispa]
MFWHVYDTLEHGLGQHSMHPMSSTYKPALFARAAKISTYGYISHFLQVAESSWRAHPAHVALMDPPPPALTAYLSRLESVSHSSDPSPLLAHAYVRYLGDLSGG